MTKTTFTVYSKTLARFLKENGCNLLKVEEDMVVPRYWNWTFENTPELHNLIDVYEEEKQYLIDNNLL